MTDFTIHSLTIIDGPPNPSGGRFLASYEITVRGIRMKGCGLTQDKHGIVHALGILGKTAKGVSVSSHYADPALARAVTRAVVEAYSALTGREVDDE